MERRHAPRIALRLKAESISGTSSHTVFIENISESGIQIITAPGSLMNKITPDTDSLGIIFSLSSGETVTLHCKVRWSYSEALPDGMTDSIGLEILDPPPQYINFVRSLHRTMFPERS